MLKRLPIGLNIAMVRKGRPGLKGGGDLWAKTLTEPTNQDAGMESEGESASIARTSETPDIAMQTIRSWTSIKTQNPQLLSGRENLENLICLVFVFSIN